MSAQSGAGEQTNRDFARIFANVKSDYEYFSLWDRASIQYSFCAVSPHNLGLMHYIAYNQALAWVKSSSKTCKPYARSILSYTQLIHLSLNPSQQDLLRGIRRNLPTEVPILRSPLSLRQLHVILRQDQRHQDLNLHYSEEPPRAGMFAEPEIKTRRRDTHELMSTLGLGIRLRIAFWVSQLVEAETVELIRIWEVVVVSLEAVAIETDPLAFRYDRAI